jgi:4-hydroxy-tetrahydrodipicolinate synthase/2-keto-3-deoxy-L-arabinonate dehydratase
MTPQPFRGVFPVVPTIFTETGELDLAGQRRCVDFMIDAGSDGLCILANFSEQFLLSDEERLILTREILDHVGRRVPVIVTTSHFSSKICGERSRQAENMGAAMVMVMPPYHGATFRVGERQIVDFFERICDGLSIPVMIQDAPVAGTPLPAALLARMAQEIANVSYFKIETQGATAKLRELVRLGGDAVIGPWDGEEGITLLPDLEAGATGTMIGGGFPDGVKPIVEAYHAGRREEAIGLYERWLPLINLENRQCGLLAAKALMKEGGVIDCEMGRHPLAPIDPLGRRLLIETARRLDALALRWAR